MRCIYCEKDSPYKFRTGQRCGHCRKPFAFEPKNGDPVTDPMFHSAVTTVSGQGELRWLARNVRFAVCRRMFRMARRDWVRRYLALSVFPGIFPMLALGQRMMEGYGYSLETAIAIVFAVWMVVSPLFWVFLRPGPQARLDEAQFQQLWSRWRNTHELPPGLVEPGFAETVAPDLEETSASSADREELERYAFDRAVVCERPELVDLLVANDFHFEHSCAIVSADGYPSRVFDTLRTMMGNNPALEVFVLHDAAPEGCALTQRLRKDPSWFFDTGAKVTDIGLKPRHARIVNGCFDAATGPGFVPDPHELKRSELRWLNRYRCEVLALRPAALLKRTFAAMGHPGSDSFG